MIRSVAVALLFSLTFAASAQDVRLRGLFTPLTAPEADTRAPTGEARSVIDEDGDLRVDLVAAGVPGRVTAVTLHAGRAGESGEQVARIDPDVSGDEVRVIGATLDLSPAIAARVRAGEAYLLVRTSERPDGVLRAQLSPLARTLDSAATGN